MTSRPATLGTTSLGTSGPVLASEYYTEAEMAAKFKKVRKVKKPLRTLKADDLLEPEPVKQEGMEVDQPTSNGKTPKLEKLQADDAELNVALSKTKKLRASVQGVSNRRLPEHVAVELLATTTATGSSGGAFESGGLTVISETSEFCKGVGDLPTVGEEDAVKMEVQEESEEAEEEQVEFASRKKTTGRSYRKNEDSDDERKKYLRKKEEAKSKKKQDGESGSEYSSDDDFMLGHEPKASSSMAEALRLASMKGYIEKKAPSNSNGGGGIITGKVAELQAKNFTVEEAKYNDIDAKFSGNRRRADANQRFSGPLVDFCEKTTYKPDVKLEYINDEGKKVDAKEAFTLLSHRFHGKTSGKKKIEKKLRKEAQERKIMSQSSSDTPLGTLSRLVQRQQKEKSAFVVLQSAGTSSSVDIPMPDTTKHVPAKKKAGKK